jgi:hypothetical protein
MIHQIKSRALCCGSRVFRVMPGGVVPPQGRVVCRKLQLGLGGALNGFSCSSGEDIDISAGAPW